MKSSPANLCFTATYEWDGSIKYPVITRCSVNRPGNLPFLLFLFPPHAPQRKVGTPGPRDRNTLLQTDYSPRGHKSNKEKLFCGDLIDLVTFKMIGHM